MRSNQVNNIAGHLTAANLFGFQPEKQLTEPEIKTEQSSGIIMAVFPTITDDAFARTMDNYRKYVSDYNTRTIADNEGVAKHNSAVQIYKKNNQLAQYEQEIIKNFALRFDHFNARQYNNEVDAAGDFKRFLEKRKIQPVKYPTEQIFQNFLHLYSRQLNARNKEFMRLSVRTPRPLQQLEVNAYHVTTLKRKDIFSLDVCNKTVRNHRQRLEEAGILVEYTFCGAKRGVKMMINPEILVLIDLHTMRKPVAENQLVSSDCEKVLPNTNEITITFKEDYKKRESATRSSCDKERPSAAGLSDYENSFYKNTGSNEAKNSLGGALATVKVSKSLSENLRDLILHPQELANELAAGAFDNYIPLDIRLLYKEAYNGQLTRSEFRELAIQDFFKSSAKMYRSMTVFTGSWKNAINSYMQKKWLNWQDVELQKHNIVTDIQQMRWRLEQAHRWFVRTGIQPLFPSNYFDFTRKTSKEIGFEFTLRHWQRHEKYLQQLPAKETRRKKNAELRLTAVNHSKKLETEARRFLKNKITLPQLTDFVTRNLPPEYMEKLPDTLNRLMTTLK